MSRVRSAWERELRERGLVPWGAVTRKVTLLVAADALAAQWQAQA